METAKSASRGMLIFVATILIIALALAATYFLVPTPGDPAGKASFDGPPIQNQSR
jgi:hypothetical protein